MNDEELKAMLIIDMPDNYYQCSCLQAEISYGTIRKHICGADYHKITELYKRNNCPLKPLPEKKEIQYPTTDGITTVIDCEYTLNDYLFDKGYNTCLDEIQGKYKKRKRNEL